LPLASAGSDEAPRSDARDERLLELVKRKPSARREIAGGLMAGGDSGGDGGRGAGSSAISDFFVDLRLLVSRSVQ